MEEYKKCTTHVEEFDIKDLVMLVVIKRQMDECTQRIELNQVRGVGCLSECQYIKTKSLKV